MKPKERMYRFVPRMGGVDEIRKAIGLEYKLYKKTSTKFLQTLVPWTDARRV